MSTTIDVDVAVVGAGIHGAGLAQAAAAAGYSVLLLERSAIAAGTSSRSSKLIHGGLRDLESGEIHLVRESLHERALLLRLAPELVRLRRFYVPIYRQTRRRPWQLRAGLSAYALLAAFGRGAGFGTIARRHWDQLDGLTTAGLQSVFYYHDAQTDDRALTRAVVCSAQSLGAQLICPASFVSATLLPDGVQIHYTAPQPAQCRARVLINAAGAWADTLARAISPAIAVPALERVQGAHMVLPVRVERGCYYLESPRDGRAVFALPWHDQLLVGTTETRFRGDPGVVRATAPEINYLLGVLKHYFPRWRDLTAADVRASFAGLRVLPAGAGHAFHRSRETTVVTDREHRPRVLSVYGGKLTTWRCTAQRAFARVAGSLPQRRALARTDRLPLHPARDDAATATDT
ncbi:MAG: glycerol-3-phosphate dehydrogenase/oxidase [Steroidobacteraceae bacterium]